MKHGYLWLTLRLMKGQKLRTWTIFCGILFSCFLLSAFGSLGYDFWMQIHEGTSQKTEFDATQWILVALVLVLLLLVVSCSVILLHNLFSLTFLQKWRSLNRLMILGATQSNIISMVVTEIGIIYCVATPLGQILSFLLGKWIDVKFEPPLWMLGGILIWMLVISCICGIRPALLTIRKPMLLSGMGSFPKIRHCSRKKRRHSSCFASFMAKKYYLANRGHYIRIILTIIVVIVLYVPVSYLINTNLQVQQSELYKKYGISYTYAPQNEEELIVSLEEYRSLAEVNTDGVSMVYVTLPGLASVKSELLSDDLLDVLRKAGWNEEAIWESDSMLYFLEDAYYETYLQSCSNGNVNTANSFPVIMFNKYINRTSWADNTDNLYLETSLLNKETGYSGVEVYYSFSDGELTTDQSIVPNMLSNELPDGIDFTGNISFILPLSQLEVVCSNMESFWGVQVCGCFEDNNETLFDNMYQCLGENMMGQLRYTRKVFQEWYQSMKGIHMAMASICAILFFIALLNVFSTMIFQYIERKKGLAVLWSLGQTKNELLKILVLENVRSFAAAIIIGVPASSILCYYIYSIFRYVWCIDFVLPYIQIILIIISAMIVSVIAILIDWRLMKHQNYLQAIRKTGY